METTRPSSGIATADGDLVRKRLAQAHVLTLGWVSLFIGVGIPAAASAAAVRLFWNVPCYAGVRWTFAPLVIACEPVSALRTTLGWIATAVCLAALTGAVVIGARSAALWMRSAPKRDALASGLFFGAVAAVVVVVALVLASDPDASTNSRGAWIGLSSFAALGAAVFFGAVSAIVLLIASARRARQVS